MTKHLAKSVMLMSMALVMASSSGVCTYASEIPDTSFIVDYEEDMEEPLIIQGAKNIYIDKDKKIDILKGVTTNKEAKLTVSKYDKNLVNKNQVVTITATTPDGEEVTSEIILRIRWFKVKSVKAEKYATVWCNVREKPTSKSKKLGIIKYNQKVEVLGKVYANGLSQVWSKNTWYKIRYNGKIAYVTTKYFVNKKIKKIAYVGKDGIGVETTEWGKVMLDRSSIDSGWWSRDGDHLSSELWDKWAEEEAKKNK